MKSYAMAVLLSSVITAGPVMAESEFRALDKVSGVTAMSEGRLASVEGGVIKHGSGTCSGVGNVCLNLAIPTITAVNLGLFSKNANQFIVQKTTQVIR
ncbi:hypothetical protein [Methylocaldum szegediense]|uniref:Uncharacterized protein n=1 Tax=Methylocaldum szegediense TaxID=73780 RepID=A0ABM9HY75_9GAMM|nr:hypothetical protein [Methylocaldum szegediense]CAI8764543.1 conserved exported protein of unknown function [Methylocaldum szegediense]